MSEVNPASKEANTIQHAPYKCAACGQPADEIMATTLGSLLVLWHGGDKGCKAIINAQMMAVPRQAQSPILTPGGGKLII